MISNNLANANNDIYNGFLYKIYDQNDLNAEAKGYLFGTIHCISGKKFEVSTVT